MPTQRLPNQIERDKLFFKAGGIRELVGFLELEESEINPGPVPVGTNSEAYLRFRRIWNLTADEKFPRYSSGPILRPGELPKSEVSQWLAVQRKRPGLPLVALCPFSNMPSKDLTDRTIAEILAGLEKNDDVEIVLIGGEKDRKRATGVIAHASHVLNACGAFSVAQSAALLQMCRLAVCVDSGPMHLAAAVGTPCVVAFSRIADRVGRWLPLGLGHTILHRDVACAGCRFTHCPIPGHPCMDDITAAQIVYATQAKLAGKSPTQENLGGTRLLNLQTTEKAVTV